MTTNKAGEQPTITQTLVDRWEAEWMAAGDAHWGDKINWHTAKEIARRIDDTRTTSLAAQDGLVEALAELRGAGWMVAVHNDYRLCGNNYTFWLFTHPDGRWIKGEAESDLDAVNAALSAIKGDKS